MRKRKEYRELTVGYVNDYGSDSYPMVRMKGAWLRDLGFNPGDPILVKCEDGQITITKNEALQSLKKEEEAQIAAAERRLEKQFQSEKKRIREMYVAERSECFQK